MKTARNVFLMANAALLLSFARPCEAQSNPPAPAAAPSAVQPPVATPTEATAKSQATVPSDAAATSAVTTSMEVAAKLPEEPCRKLDDADKTSTSKDPAKPEQKVRYHQFPTRAHEASIGIETNILVTEVPAPAGFIQLNDRGTIVLSDRRFVAMSLVPKASFDIFDAACKSVSHYIDLEVPIGFTLNQLSTIDGSLETARILGNPTLGWHLAAGTIRSEWVFGFGVHVTLPFNDGEFKSPSEQLAMGVLSGAQSGYDAYRFSSAFFVVETPFSLEVMPDPQVRLGVELMPTLYFPTFGRFNSEWTRVGLNGAFDAAFRTEGPTTRLVVGLRGQMALLSKEQKSAPLAVTADANTRCTAPYGCAAALGALQNGTEQFAVEPYAMIDAVSTYVRVGAIVPVTRPLAFGIHPNEQLNVRVMIGQRF